MPLLSLPDECLSDLFSFLDDISLYRCLFVNRDCCRLAVPILWKKPFRPSFVNEKYSSIMNTLFSCLNEDEIISLIPCAIYFSNNQLPLFEYGRFIRVIDQEFVKQNIITWLNSSSGQVFTERYDIAKYQDCRVPKLISVIYHMIMRQGSNLQEVNLRVFQSDFYIDLPKFSIFTTYNPGIANLRALKVDIDLEPSDNIEYQKTIEFLSMVSTFCNSISSCSLLIYKLNRSFVKQFLNIIKSQPLKRVLIYTNFLEEHKKDILYSLEFRSKTLKELVFIYMDFQNIDLSFMSKLECLEKLEFDNCEGFTNQHCNVFSKKQFYLKELKLWHDDIDDLFVIDTCNVYDQLGTNIDVIVRMINILGGKSLAKLSLNIITPETIKAVKESSPNISFLYIRIASSKNLNSIIPLVCDLPSLKVLHIQISAYGANNNGCQLVEILGDNLTFVEDLYLDVLISLSSFKYFTDNCKANLRKWIIPYNEQSRKDYLTCVDNYQRVHNSLKVLGIDENEDGFCWNNEELEIIDSLKSQDVDIVSSSQLIKLFY